MSDGDSLIQSVVAHQCWERKYILFATHAPFFPGVSLHTGSFFFLSALRKQ